MPIYSVVGCAEEHASTNEAFSIKDPPTATVVLRCAWADRYALVNDILLNRRPWPQYSALNVPRAANASIVPVATEYTENGQSADYIDALCTINYSTEVNDLFSEELEPTSEFMRLDHKRFRWGSGTGDALLEGEAPGRLVRGLNIVRNLLQVPPPLSSQFIDLVGYVNSDVVIMSTTGFTFQPETLLYTPPHLSRTYKSDGSDGYSITLKFMYKKDGWNNFWRAKTQQNEKIYIAGGNLPYDNHPSAPFAFFWL